MEQRRLGSTGLRVSELCFGAMMFGGGADERVAHAMLDAFTEAGGTFIDTADVYGQGVSEEVLGRWLKGRVRDDLVIATKVFLPMGEAPNARGLSRKHVLAAVEASLRRLGTDHVDLYQTHVWDAHTPIEETLATLDTLVRSGKVRYLGASNHGPGQLQKVRDVAHARGWEPYVCLQPIYNLLAREAEWELLPLCRAEGVGVIPYSPLHAGWLSGKYRRGMEAPPEGARGGGAWDERATEATWRVVDAVLGVAEETGRTPAQVSLRWLLQRPGVTAPIVGARSVEQLTDNLGAVGWALDEDQLRRLDAASARPLPPPYDVLAHFAQG
ncbi:aldo/keto reductase [Streptomyces spectabilis]|uniref:Aldo/keto reductase n=1 Tax=Streptomyces spectabilis TaxID=68270 RepID=A0A5P2XE69_STRST|nr:aldo/keto reductase [Streptomyces spectabilis]MBB5105104.1 aryl-alcohol dehydrogenase-like predicted oxidoreductase [Streptomyces spectabilis]MCI3905832.1 aldo/keto reductase [Streptomyces spectabilis]QEV62758.1 aldo/keto reductase [Streptomyces spectabilis]GGV06418.1 oxidoreductase [Streptomyces spectabilis]